jgi:hypothetical protein
MRVTAIAVSGGDRRIPEKPQVVFELPKGLALTQEANVKVGYVLLGRHDVTPYGAGAGLSAVPEAKFPIEKLVTPAPLG